MWLENPKKKVNGGQFLERLVEITERETSKSGNGSVDEIFTVKQLE